MNLSLYCDVAEACRIAGVSRGYMCAMIRAGKIAGQKVGNSYAVLRSDAKGFQRQPGMGRPRKHPARPSKRRRLPARPSKTRRK